MMRRNARSLTNVSSSLMRRLMDCRVKPGNDERWLVQLGTALTQQLLDLGAERRREVGALQRIGDIGGEEADLGAAIEAAALELQAGERLSLGELDHRIGDLDLAAGAAFL